MNVCQEIACFNGLHVFPRHLVKTFGFHLYTRFRTAAEFNKNKNETIVDHMIESMGKYLKIHKVHERRKH